MKNRRGIRSRAWLFSEVLRPPRQPWGRREALAAIVFLAYCIAASGIALAVAVLS